MLITEKQQDEIYRAVVNLGEELDLIFGRGDARKAFPDEFLGKLEDHIIKTAEKYWAVVERDDDKVYAYEVPCNF